MKRCVVVLKRMKPFNTKMDQKAKKNSEKLREAQLRYDQSFSCIICLSARLEMVTGLCQHRFCSSCLYNEEGMLRPQFEKCALCQKNAFPKIRPEIPDDSKEMMKCLGVRKCPNLWCTEEMWEWELEAHTAVCKELQKIAPVSRHGDTAERALRKKSKRGPSSSTRPNTRSSGRQLYLLL